MLERLLEGRKKMSDVKSRYEKCEKPLDEACYEIVALRSYVNRMQERIQEYAEEIEQNAIECELCGCTELLCGHNKRD